MSRFIAKLATSCPVVNLDGSTVKPCPTLLFLYSYLLLLVSRNVVSCLTFSAVTSLSVLSGRNVAENESRPGRGWDSITAVSKI